jgi:hypothetical protein
LSLGWFDSPDPDGRPSPGRERNPRLISLLDEKAIHCFRIEWWSKQMPLPVIDGLSFELRPLVLCLNL